LFQRIRFLQEIRFQVDHVVVEDGLAGMAGNEEQLSVRLELR
jgi:hypothetical protein